MSEDRDQAGSPVEQVETTETQVLAAVERAAEVAVPATEEGVTGTTTLPSDESVSTTGATERPVIAATSEPPNAGKLETAEEIFAAHPPHAPAAQPEAAGVETAVVEPVEASVDATVSPAVAVPLADTALPPVRDGEIRISSDHPMAALYMQSPMAPEMKGNRGAGVLIALLSTVAFALVYAGVLALWIAPNYPPSTFLNAGLLPWILNWGFAAAAVGFFVGLALLVLIVGRAGWWAYVLGGLLVAVFTWAVSILGFALDARFSGDTVSLQPFSLLVEFGLFFPVLAAALVAREVTVWFGAWIGARGRKVRRQNAEAIAEYETALAEVQAKQP